MKSLVDADCGGPNQLVRLANQVGGGSSSGASQRLQPLPHSASAAGRLAGGQRGDVVPHSFDMHALLGGLQQTPSAVASSAVAHHHDAQAANWAQEFAATPKAAARVNSWAMDYLASGRSSAPALAGPSRMDAAWGEASATRREGLAGEKWAGDFLAAAESNLDSVEQRADAWGREFESFAAAAPTAATQSSTPASTEADFWTRLESEWDGLKGVSDEAPDWLDDYEGVSSYYSEYKFEEENPYVEQNMEDPLSEGKRRLAAGDLGGAVLLFEAAVRASPESAEAWLELGKGQAENEQEPAAIAALKKALQLQPDSAPALFGLATAYTNENLYNDAARALADWLAAQPQYAGAVDPTTSADKPRITSFIDGEFFNRVEQSFLRAAASQAGRVDPQLQNALGVLYNLSGNYERAVECLQAAIGVSPDDPRLWNRLGATLANSNRSGEAVSAYSRALELYPGFVRARYNLGISCMNLRSNREAVEHFVSALSLQQRGMGPTRKEGVSEAIWNTLRVAVNNIANDSPVPRERDHLLGFVDARDFSGLSSALNLGNPNLHDVTSSVQ